MENRPLHVRPSSLLLVLAGGTVGTAAREGLVLTLPMTGDVPWTILGINLLGAFLLGWLLDALARRGPDHGRRRALRLLLGTGVLGGFTTYSTLATDTAVLTGDSPLIGLGYALATILIGAVATCLGILMASALHRGQSEVA